LEQQPLEQQLFDSEGLAASAGVALTEQLLAASQQQPRISQTQLPHLQSSQYSQQAAVASALATEMAEFGLMI
jgi:hypothetical protein